MKHNISKQAILEKEVSKIGFVQVRRKKIVINVTKNVNFMFEADLIIMLTE